MDFFSRGLWLFAVAFLFFSACKKKADAKQPHAAEREAVRPADPLQPADYKLYNEIRQKELSFTTLSARAETAYNDGLIAQDFTTVFRIKKDSVIWVSLQGPFGIEGARVLLRPDSFFLDNKLNGEKIADNLAAIVRYIGVPVDFQTIQRILLGQLLTDYPTLTMQPFNDSTQLIFQQNAKSDCYTYIDLKKYTPTEIVWKDLLQGIEMNATFDEYKSTENAFFSYKRNYTIRQKNSKREIDMNFTKLRINEPLSFPF